MLDFRGRWGDSDTHIEGQIANGKPNLARIAGAPLICPLLLKPNLARIAGAPLMCPLLAI